MLDWAWVQIHNTLLTKEKYAYLLLQKDMKYKFFKKKRLPLQKHQIHQDRVFPRNYLKEKKNYYK